MLIGSLINGPPSHSSFLLSCPLKALYSTSLYSHSHTFIQRALGASTHHWRSHRKQVEVWYPDQGHVHTQTLWMSRRALWAAAAKYVAAQRNNPPRPVWPPESVWECLYLHRPCPQPLFSYLVVSLLNYKLPKWTAVFANHSWQIPLIPPFNLQQDLQTHLFECEPCQKNACEIAAVINR